MYRRILVALDQTPFRHQLFKQAIVMAKAMNAELMLTHVLTAYDEGSPGLPVRAYHAYYPVVDTIAWDTYQRRWESYEKTGLEDLHHFAEEAQTQGIKAEFMQAAGDPGRVICEIAESWGADLIVVGNRGRVGLSELLLGSVSNYVMHHTACSVLVVHSEDSKETPSAQEEKAKVTVG